MLRAIWIPYPKCVSQARSLPPRVHPFPAIRTRSRERPPRWGGGPTPSSIIVLMSAKIASPSLASISRRLNTHVRTFTSARCSNLARLTSCVDVSTSRYMASRPVMFSLDLSRSYSGGKHPVPAAPPSTHTHRTRSATGPRRHLPLHRHRRRQQRRSLAKHPLIQSPCCCLLLGAVAVACVT